MSYDQHIGKCNVLPHMELSKNVTAISFVCQDVTCHRFSSQREWGSLIHNPILTCGLNGSLLDHINKEFM